MNGKIIVLNGTSSSGKTTIARALQKQCSDVYLLCSLDAFWDMTPYGIPAGSKNFPDMKLALAKSVKALAETGHNVIVDIVFCGRKTYLELSKVLESFTVKIVKVECPLDELEKREINRGDRAIGLAKLQYEPVHEGVLYDLTLNTLNDSPKQCVEKIIDTFSCFGYNK